MTLSQAIEESSRGASRRAVKVGIFATVGFFSQDMVSLCTSGCPVDRRGIDLSKCSDYRNGALRQAVREAVLTMGLRPALSYTHKAPGHCP